VPGGQDPLELSGQHESSNGIRKLEHCLYFGGGPGANVCGGAVPTAAMEHPTLLSQNGCTAHTTPSFKTVFLGVSYSHKSAISSPFLAHHAPSVHPSGSVIVSNNSCRADEAKKFSIGDRWGCRGPLLFSLLVARNLQSYACT